MRSLNLFVCLSTLAFAGFGQSAATLTLAGNAVLTGGTGFSVGGTGSISGFGNAALSAAGTIDNSILSGQSSGPILGTFSLIYSTGDILTGTFSIPSGFLIPNVGGSSNATGSAKITGGTGRFTGASGIFPSLTGSGTSTGATSSSFSVSGSGTVSVGQRILPQLAFGGAWYSALYFTNTGSTSAAFTVNFVGDDGKPLLIPSANGSSVSVNLPPRGSTIIEAVSKGPLVQGYASVVLPPGVTGYGVFRQSLAGIPDQEAVVPLSGASATTSTLLWDETNFVTGAAIVNLGSAASTVTITAHDVSGNIIGATSLNLLPFAKAALQLRSQVGLAAIAGTRGSADFTISSGNIAVLGLRFDGASFTSIPTSDR